METNKHVLIVGLSPSKLKHNNKCKTHQRLYEWLDYLNIETFSFVNLVEEQDFSEDKIDEIFIKKCTEGYNIILGLGAIVSKTLNKFSIEHFSLPHPSPRNRKLNDVAYVRDILNNCKEWIKYQQKNKINTIGWNSILQLAHVSIVEELLEKYINVLKSELTKHEIVEIYKRHPTLKYNKILNKIEPNHWRRILFYNNNVKDHCPWDKITSETTWRRILINNPEFIVHCKKTDHFSHSSWTSLIMCYPHLIKYCSSSKKKQILPYQWLRILRKHPELFHECYFDHFKESKWTELLELFPEKSEFIENQIIKNLLQESY